MVITLWIFLVVTKGLNCLASCPETTVLNLTRPDVFCAASSSMHGMPCQNAWDDSRSTIWHPGTSGLDATTAIYLKQSISIKKVKVEQYKWVTGYASAIVLEVNGETFPLKDASNYVKDHSEMEWRKSGDTEALVTKLVQLRITEVGPRRGSAFGGIHTIQLVGCWHNDTKEQTKPDEKVRNGVRSAKGAIQTTSRKSSKDEDVFFFDYSGDALPRSSGSEKSNETELGLSIPLLIAGVLLILVGVFLALMVVGLKARRKYLVSEAPRVRISPSSMSRMESQDRLQSNGEEDDIENIPYP